MIIKIVETEDGSTTLLNESLGDIYHSRFGAISESQHIYIENGFLKITGQHQQLNILEVGYGTGLNIMLSYLARKSKNQQVNYIAIEPFPLHDEVINRLIFPGITDHKENNKLFKAIHQQAFNVSKQISNTFSLTKFHCRFEDFNIPKSIFNLVYFDAFAPDIQPELWNLPIFKKIATGMKRGGILVTYSTKGLVKRNLKSAGFTIKKVPGPIGKREILTAINNSDEQT